MVEDFEAKRVLDALAELMDKVFGYIDDLDHAIQQVAAASQDQNIGATLQWLIDQVNELRRLINELFSLIEGLGTTTVTPYTGENSIDITDYVAQLVNDTASPGNSKMYGTSATGERGWQSVPTGLPDMTGQPAGSILYWNGTAWVALTPVVRRIIHTILYSESTKSLTYGWQDVTVIAAGSSGGTTVFTAEECAD